ncbi:MAG: rRNA maturation RNase YbeY [Deltaproteobacteria bacterium]|nr:rRNA maturation RNase YbeY [Deltaproteobacteria bacterium]
MTESSPKIKSYSSNSNIVDVACKGIDIDAAFDVDEIEERAQQILAFMGCNRCELSVVLCNDSFIQELNQEYRQKNMATDVLSFPLSEIPLEKPLDTLLGDVVVSVDTALRQATEFNDSLMNEMTSLIVHGILHLLGYSHENDENEAKMKAMAFELLNLFKN